MKLYLVLFSYISVIFITNAAFITEHEFTNDTPDAAIAQFYFTRNTCLTPMMLRYAVTQARENGINPIVLLCLMQKESSLIDGGTEFRGNISKAMGYHILDKTNAGYYIQVQRAAACLRYHYDTAKATVRTQDKGVISVNRAEYALYRYNPIWSMPHEERKQGRVGNSVFAEIWKRWNEECNELWNY